MPVARGEGNATSCSACRIRAAEAGGKRLMGWTGNGAVRGRYVVGGRGGGRGGGGGEGGGMIRGGGDGGGEGGDGGEGGGEGGGLGGG